MSYLKNMTGQRFTRLLVLSKEPSVPGKHTFWKCQCDCGNVVSVDGTKLRRGTIKSCGCYRRENSKKRMTKHGLSSSAEHISWTNMQQRCHNINRPDYQYYGGRGITICEEWLGPEGFINFYNDMGPKPFPEATLERLNVNDNYKKSNCCWVRQKDQTRNQRYNIIKDMDEANYIRNLYENGKSISDIAKDYDCSKSCIERIINGRSWS